MEPRETALTPKQVLAMYGSALATSEGTLANWRNQKVGPKYFKTGKAGKKVIYRPSDIEDFLFSNPVHTRDSMEGR